MASQYSLTIQLANPSISDKSPGHVAVVINTPDGQTYAGFGPASHDWKSLGGMWASPSFRPQTVPPGTVPPDASDPLNYSTVFGHSSYGTFTIPISQAQAEAANAEIARIKQAIPDYIFGYEMCATITNQIMQAAGLGSHLFANPSKNFQSLTEIAKTLAQDPKAQFTRDGLFIPESFRGLQQDYALVGSGYDTPSERTGHVPSRRQDSSSQTPKFDTAPAAMDSFGDRFGNWSSAPAGAQPPASDRPESFDSRFGNWGSVPAGGFVNSSSRTPQDYKRSATPAGPAPSSAQGALPATPASQPYTADTGGILGKFWDSLITPAEAAQPPAQGARLLTPYFPGQEPTFGDRSGNASGKPSPDTYPQVRRMSSAFPGMTLPDPDQPAPPQPGTPLGIFTGKPMPSWTTPPPFGRLLNNANPSGNIDVVKFLTGLLPRDPPQQTADSIPERRLGRSTYSVSPAGARRLAW